MKNRKKKMKRKFVSTTATTSPEEEERLKKQKQVDDLWALEKKARLLMDKQNKDETSTNAKINTLIKKWEKERRDRGWNKPISSARICNALCRSTIRRLGGEEAEEQGLYVYVCDRCGNWHHCTRDGCKSLMIGQDSGYYCLFSSFFVDSEYVAGQFKRASHEGLDVNEEEDGGGMSTLDVEEEDDDEAAVIEEEDLSHLDAVNRVRRKAVVTFSMEKQDEMDRLLEHVDKADHVQQRFDDKEPVRFHGKRPAFIDLLVDENISYHVMEAFEKKEEEEEEEKEQEEEESKTKINLFVAPRLPFKERFEAFEKEFRKTWSPAFFDIKSALNYVIPLAVPCTFSLLQKHATRMSDASLLKIKEVIRDLLFGVSIRRKINQERFDTCVKMGIDAVERYFKSCNSKKPNRPVLHRMDALFDHEMSRLEKLTLYEENDAIVNFLASVILDMWFLVCSSHFYEMNMSAFDVDKHTLALLYIMRDNFQISTSQEQNIVLLPRNEFLLKTLPQKKELYRFSSRTHTYQSKDINVGKNNVSKAINAIPSSIKARVLVEMRERFNIHRRHFLTNVDVVTLRS
jgi:hypothetical protein